MRCTQPRPTPTPIPSHPIPSHPCLLRCLHDVYSKGELRFNGDARCTHLLSDLVDHHLSSSETTDIFIRSLQQSLAGYIRDLETQQVTQPKWVSTLHRDIWELELGETGGMYLLSSIARGMHSIPSPPLPTHPTSPHPIPSHPIPSHPHPITPHPVPLSRSTGTRQLGRENQTRTPSDCVRFA